MEEVGGRGLKRLLKTLDDEQTDVNLSNNVAPNNISTPYNIINNITPANLANIAPRGNLQRNLNPVRQENNESNFLSFSLTKQYILYDVYGNGRDRKHAKLLIGQSPYTLESESQNTQSTEEIDAELDKVKELFAAGFIQQGTIYRKAIGRAESLGALYDGRSDKFCGISLLSAPLPREDVNIIDWPHTSYAYVNEDSFSQKFSSLNIEAQLKVSVMCGLLSLEGSGKYLGEHKESARSFKVSLIYQIFTKQENLNLNAVSNLIAINALESREATHVVTGIKWGATVICSLEMSDAKDEDKKTIEGSLKAQMDKIASAVKVEGKAEVDFTEKEKQILNKLSIKFSGDIIPQDRLPQSVTDALELMKTVPQLIQQYNDGKGKPLEYTLVSIKDVESLLKHNVHEDRLLRKVDEATLIRIEHEFSDFIAAKQNFNDYFDTIMSLKDLLNEISVEQFIQKKKDIQIYESRFREAVAIALKAIRTGDKDVHEIEAIITENHADPCSSAGITKFINNNQATLNNVNFVTQLKRKGVEPIPRTSSPVQVVQEYSHCDVFILYYSKPLQEGDAEELWEENFTLFLQLAAEYAANHSSIDAKFFAVDYETHTSRDHSDTVAIHHYINGRAASRDYLRDNGKLYASNLVQPHSVDHSKKTHCEDRLCLPCPGMNGLCQNTAHEWTCFKCLQQVVYNFDDSLCYCKCGAWRPNDASYKCNDLRHGSKFTEFGSEEDLNKLLPHKPSLETELSITPPSDEWPEEIVIAVLGETIADKALFINALVNYLVYCDLNNAAKIVRAVPAMFTATNENYIPHSIKIGDPDPSNTAPKQYVVTFGSKKVRFIDTPDFGNGTAVNFQAIFERFSNEPFIHAIYVILKPNSVQLNDYFKRSIDELTSNLHGSAKLNIIYCFANAPFSPAETIPPLQTHIAELNVKPELAFAKKNTFGFDNEPFRFLAATKSGIEFSKEEAHTASKSWEASVKEARRLLQHTCSMTPHRPQDTVAFMKVRNFIERLATPIIDITCECHTYEKMLIDTWTKSNTVGNKIIELKKRAKALSEELDTITDNVAKIASFLRQNGLTTRNNAFTTQLCAITEGEEIKAFYKDVVVSICDHLQTISAIIVSTEDTQIDNMMLADIDNLIQQMYDLPLCGAKLKVMIESPNPEFRSGPSEPKESESDEDLKRFEIEYERLLTHYKGLFLKALANEFPAK